MLKIFCMSIVLLSLTIVYGYSQNLVKNSGLKMGELPPYRDKWAPQATSLTIENADVYYVSQLGNDENSGTSEEEAWQTIAKVNTIDFKPGDKILFNGGDIFTGNIQFSDSGTVDSVIHIGSYGIGRATINAGTGNGFWATNCEYINIKNLNFEGVGRLTNSGDGIAFSDCSHIVVDSVDVSGFQHSGLTVRSIGKNYYLTNINTHHNGFAGIYISGIDKTSLSDIYVGHCVADYNLGDPTVLDNHSGNGIFAFNSKNILIEFCKASHNGSDMPRIGNGPGGIWVAEVDSAIIQYCISHDNKTSDGGQDGLGFDLDGGTTNTIIQYCLSYDNWGAGYGIFQYGGATDWNNNTVRYCISENDGNVSAKGSVYFWNGSGTDTQFQGFEFYNNVVYNENGPALAFLDHKNLNFNFRNNIFVSKNSSVYNWKNYENYQGNCWYSFNGQFQLGNSGLDFNTWAQANNQEIIYGEIVGMYADPKLLNPGISSLTDPKMLASIDDYKVKEGSPAIDAGLDLETLFTINPGNHDYFGKSIQQAMVFDMGVDQYLDKQVINFTTGWNIISTNLLPFNLVIDSVFQSLISNGSLIKIQDENGNSLENLGIYGEWKNNIGDIELTEGYKVKVSGDDSIQVYGPAMVDYPYAIPLKMGWNIIGYPQIKTFDGLDVMQELIARNSLIKVQDKAGNSIEDLGVYGGWNNTIGDFEAGEGYKIKVSGDDTLWISDSYPKSASLQPALDMATHFIPAYKGNGTDHMNIHLVNLTESGIIEGDEIGVFDGNICVGSAKVNIQGSTFKVQHSVVNIPVSAADGNSIKNGYTAGNTVTVKLYRNGDEHPLAIEPLNKRKPTFEIGGSLFVQLNLTTEIKRLPIQEGTGIKCYPNPFNDEITIEINLVIESEVEAKVLNQSGQQVKIVTSKRLFPKGMHNFVWNGKNMNNQPVTPGIYHLRMKINDDVFLQKIVLLN